jgi:hypothetical protein
MFGIGMGSMGRLKGSLSLAGKVKKLFADGQAGAWYDFSQFNQEYQDSAGTVPITAAEQPLGKVNDVSGRGNNITQATAGSRPVLSSLQNLLTSTEGLVTTYPARGNVIEAAQPIAGFATSVHFNQSGVLGYAYKPVATVIDGQPYTMSVYIQMDDGGIPVGGNTGGSADFALVISGSLDNTLLIEQVGSSSVYRVTGTFNGNSALNASFGVIKYVGNSARTFRVAGYHVVQGSVSTPYQRVNTTADYSAIGFPFYAKFDGVDDSMTSATGGGATTGFFWCGGVRSLSATGVFDIGDRVGNAGYFARVAGASAPTFFAGNGAALTSITSAVSLSLGVTSLVTAWDDGVNLNIQVNAGAIATIARPAIAAGGAPFYHTGNTPVHIYPSIYRTGTPLTATERTAAQAWCKSKAGL